MVVATVLQYRRLYAEMERIKSWKEKILRGCRYYNRSSGSRLGHWLVVIAGCACAVGCTTMKKAGIVSLGAGSGALVGSVLGTGAVAPIVGATTTAFVTDVITEATPIGGGGKQTMSNCAPDNFWTLLGSLVEMGGWLLILIFIAPMILGWILPGPLDKKKKSKK